MLLLSFGLWTLNATGQNESAAPQKTTANNNTNDQLAGPPGPPTGEPLTKVTIQADKSEEVDLSVMAKIDRLAKTAVDHIANVLFLRFLASNV